MTAFSRFDNIQILFTFPLCTITKTGSFCVKVYFCLIVHIFLPRGAKFILTWSRFSQKHTEIPIPKSVKTLIICGFQTRPKLSVNVALPISFRRNPDRPAATSREIAAKAGICDATVRADAGEECTFRQIKKAIREDGYDGACLLNHPFFPAITQYHSAS